MQLFRKLQVKKIAPNAVKVLYLFVIAASLLAPAQPASFTSISLLTAHAQVPAGLQTAADLAYQQCRGNANSSVATCTQQNIDQGLPSPSATAEANLAASGNKPPPKSGGFPDQPSGTGCLSGGFNFDLCITNIVYVFTAGIMSVFAYVGGVVFSIAVQLSLNSVAYSLNFLSSGWAAVRDIANMAFIFILIYLAFTIMLGAETHGTNKTLATVLVMALLINFSFFIVRVVIDGGNILAVQFYNSIDAPSIDQSVNSSGVTSGAGVASLVTPANTKDLTASIMKVLSITKLFNTSSFTAFRDKNNGLQGFLVVVITLSLLYIALGIIFGILASTFFFVGFKFIYRVIALWFVIILSPLAFVARGLSNTGSQKFYRLWQNMLVQFAFYPAIFLFIFLLISYFVTQMSVGGNIVDSLFGDLNALSNTSIGENGNFLYVIGKVIGGISIRLGMVIILLFFGLKISDMIVTEGNKGAEKVTGWAGRALGGVMYGGLGYAGRNSIGAAARSYAPQLQEKASSSTGIRGALWRGTNNANKAVALGSYDVRGVPRVQSTLLKSSRLDVGSASKSRFGLLAPLTAEKLTKIDKDTKTKIALAAKANAKVAAAAAGAGAATTGTGAGTRTGAGTVGASGGARTGTAAGAGAAAGTTTTPTSTGVGATPGAGAARYSGGRTQPTFAPIPVAETTAGAATTPASTGAAAGTTTTPTSTGVGATPGAGAARYSGGRTQPTFTPIPKVAGSGTPLNSNVTSTVGRKEPTVVPAGTPIPPAPAADHIGRKEPTFTPIPKVAGSGTPANNAKSTTELQAEAGKTNVRVEPAANTHTDGPHDGLASTLPPAPQAEPAPMSSTTHTDDSHDETKPPTPLIMEPTPHIPASATVAMASTVEPARVMPHIYADPSTRLKTSSSAASFTTSSEEKPKSAWDKAGEEVEKKKIEERQKEEAYQRNKLFREIRHTLKKAGQNLKGLTAKKAAKTSPSDEASLAPSTEEVTHSESTPQENIG